ncbi:MAG: divalent cation tolerance protein CutA [Candidatus Micrarchaeia archaeon]
MYIVRTTVAAMRDAKEMSEALVSRRLCACAWISRISSVYMWKGRLRHGAEFLVEAKCLNMKTASHAAKAIASMHKYEIPMIEVSRAGPVNHEYSKWLSEETG